MEVIQDREVNAKQSEVHFLIDFYYLVWRKNYFEEKNTWEPISVLKDLQKLISSFHKDHLNKPTVRSLPIDITTLMSRLTKLLAMKQKCG